MSVAGDKDLQLELLCSTKNRISISMKKAGDHEIAHEVRGGLVLMRLKNKADGQSFRAAYQRAHSAQRPSGDHVDYHL